MSHYEVLEVSERASLAVVNAAWKVLMQRYHPDGSEPDEDKARQVNAAHDVLEDPQTRRKYDLNLAQDRAAEYRQQQSCSSSVTDMFNQNGAYPSAYPPDILQMMAQRMGTAVLSNMINQVPELAFLINTAMKRGGRA